MLNFLLLSLFFAGPSATPPPELGVYLEEVDDSFSAPLYLTAPDGDTRKFVVERGGKVKVVTGNHSVLSTPYLDVGNLLPASAGGEQGLLGMAFHPAFASNGKLYISYTDSVGALVVAELVANPAANTVSAAGLKTVIRIPQPASNHNGGMILFGPDKYLYVGVGDGGGGGDPGGNGQNKDTLLGSILRVNVDGDDFPESANKNYAIPADNPFVDAAGADEIWVYGLRNPWRFWIDHPTGRLYIGDVGQSAREEVTVLESDAGGTNLGWNRLEGTLCYPPGTSCSSSDTVLPQIDYPRSIGTSVTGGVVYRGSHIPSLYGTYFYGDFPSGWVRSFEFTGSVKNHYDWRSQFSTSLVASFGVDGLGEMYVVSLGGTVWRVEGPPMEDEMLFYRDDGLYRYYDIKPNGDLGSPIQAGPGYTSGWSSITSVDLEGDGRDEMFFYRDDGLFRFYDIRPDATLPAPILAGSGYTTGWDAISAIDLDGDGQDEMFFYREDGLFRYYDIEPDGQLGSPILAGSGYTAGWDAITAVDLDGDGFDEIFFYRDDGLFRYYNIRPDAALGFPIHFGDEYTVGWDAITAVDLGGDGKDEMFFYRDDGLFRYYLVRENGHLSDPILAGNGYTMGWSSITSVNLD